VNRAFFITATGTDVGKTHVTCALIRHWRRQGVAARAL
jgi:dethiobiotin synthetase